jgi:hypothetical protein
MTMRKLELLIARCRSKIETEIIDIRIFRASQLSTFVIA